MFTLILNHRHLQWNLLLHAHDERQQRPALERETRDVDISEIHDRRHQINKLHRLVEEEATTYGGDGPVVNPSGGLISKGHPLGATGLAQASELTWQLRGQADKRQVDDAKFALQHNIGLGGAAVVTVYGRPS